MTRSGFLLGLFNALIAALLVIFAYSTGVSRWFVALGLALLAGTLAATIIGSRFATGRNPMRIDRLKGLKDERAINFSPKLLDATINEMREGLLVIDQEMRVIASNRAARNLFSQIESPIVTRRLTELTRNPAIYDAFLDGLRGKERAGVKVETHGGSRRIFDLRVVPLQSANGSAGGAVGVFFDITRLERLELIRQEFLSNVSHELRTPLTAIIALAETLEAGALDDPETQSSLSGNHSEECGTHAQTNR
jgi:PAS domain S-box-containing protein